MKRFENFEDTKYIVRKPKLEGFYWAKVQGSWEPVSVFKNGIILIGSDEILDDDKIKKIIDEFGDRLTPPWQQSGHYESKKQ
jgi:hypothetical protein